MSIKVTCFTTDTNGKSEKIGLIMLNLRTAQPVRNTQLQTVDFKWHRLLHVPSTFKAFHPEICLQLTIRDKLYNEDVLNEKPITPRVEPVVQTVETSIEHEEIIAPIYLEEGWIQLGNKKEECQKYLLKFVVGTASNMDLLLDKDQVFNRQNEGYYLAISILGLQINTKCFYKNLHEPIVLNDRIIIKLLTSPKILNQMFNDLEIVPIYFYYGIKILATANINLKEFFKDTDENSFFNEQNCGFYLEVNNEMPCFNDRKPYVSIDTILEPYCAKSDTTLASSANSNDSITFKVKYKKEEDTSTVEENINIPTITTITDENDTESLTNSSEQPVIALIPKSISSTNDNSFESNESAKKSIITNVQKYADEQSGSIELKQQDINAIKEYKTWLDENKPKIGTDNIEIKFHPVREVYTSESETHFTDSNHTFGEEQKSGANNLEANGTNLFIPNNLQLSPKELRQELRNCKDEDIITITTPKGQKIMKTVKSLLMESLNACGDVCKNNVKISLSEVAVQTTPRVFNAPKPGQSLLHLSSLERKNSRIVANFDCPRDEYRLYRLEVIFRTITWRQVFTYDGFQFKINHPKANNFLVITCDLKDIQCRKDNIILDDVYFNIYFISQDENILHLTAMYPPKISVQTFNDQNLVEDFDLYTKLMLNQGTRECNYFAVPNSLWDTDEIVCDIQIDMKIHNVDTTTNLFKSEFDLEPIVLDDWFALKTLAELEQWKEKQEILFQDNLKRIQCEKLELLQAEWNVKRMELEIKLQSGLEKCKALAVELNATADKYRTKNKNEDKSEDMQLKVTQLVEEQMKQSIRRLENEKFELLKSIEQLKYEKKELENKIQHQAEALEEMRKTTLSKEQTKLVFKELKNLEEKFNNALMEKAFFKEEWHKALKEAHALKAADQRLIQQEIQKNKAELNHLTLEQFYQLKNSESEEDTDENYDSLKITEISPYVY